MKTTDSALITAVTDIAASDRPALRNGMSGCEWEIPPAPSHVIDVITIGDEATVSKPVQRGLIGSGWIVRHADTVHSAGALLATNSAAVAVVEADDAWVDILSSLRSLRNPPEVVFISDSALDVDNVLSLGAHDLLRRPLRSADLVWSIATAWHAWMKRFEEREGCG